MGYDIFLSYRRADQALARELVAALEARGVGVWWDQKIAAGVDWRDAIVENLMDSDMLVILFSEDCNQSKQLKKELALADDMDTDVIPVLIEDTKPKGHFLYELAARNWIQIFPNPETKINDLAERLTRLAEQSPNGLEGPPPTIQAEPVQAAPVETAPQAPVTPDPVAHSPPPIQPPPVIADISRRKTAKKAKAQPATKAAHDDLRHYLPFRWIDLLILIPLAIFAINSAGVDLDDFTDLPRLTELLAMGAIGLAGFGAVMFPIRYYMRRLRLKQAMWAYFTSSLTLYGLLFGAGLWYSSMKGDIGEVMMSCLGFGLFWLAFGAVAFAVYGLLHFQRTLRSFRSNVETI